MRRPGALATHTEHHDVGPVPYLFHKGQRFPFGDGDGAENHDPWGGQCVTSGLNERLAEELHFPNLIDDTHSLPWATAGTCLKMTKTVTGTPMTYSAKSSGVPLPSHSPNNSHTRDSQPHFGRQKTMSQSTRTINWPLRLLHPEHFPEPPSFPGNLYYSREVQ